MGAWGYGPTENDDAQEWLTTSVVSVFVAAITSAIERHLSDPLDDDKLKLEAEAAVALLLDLSADPPLSTILGSSVERAARENGLWDRAAAVITRLSSDEKWLAGWNDSRRKADVLQRMLTEVDLRRSTGGSCHARPNQIDPS